MAKFLPIPLGAAVALLAAAPALAQEAMPDMPGMSAHRMTGERIRVRVLDGQVAEDDVCLCVDIEAEAVEHDTAIRANDRLVTLDCDGRGVGPEIV